MCFVLIYGWFGGIMLLGVVWVGDGCDGAFIVAGSGVGGMFFGVV